MLKAKTVHYRRCHMCNSLTTCESGTVEKCHSCNKPLSQFYYFDDRLTLVLSDYSLRPEKEKMQYRPIYGLTAYWEIF